jgi:FMN phosphatase YigB (HAD superfamily)
MKKLATHGVLFDVGYGLMDEAPRLDAALRWLSLNLKKAGIECSVEQLHALYREECRAPVPGYLGLIGQTVLAAGGSKSLAEQFRRELPWDVVPLTDLVGARDALLMLRDAGLRIGVLANQPASALEDLNRTGLGPLLDDIWLSGVIGLSKPDPLFFQAALGAWKIPPERVAYVGDRLDYDVAPAKRLGMYAVRMLVGPHIAQQARSPDECADFESPSLIEIAQHLCAWQAGSGLAGTH